MEPNANPRRRRTLPYAYAVVFALLFAALAVAVSAGATLPLDLAVRAAVHGFASNRVTGMARLFSFIGSNPVWIGAAATIAATLWLTAHRTQAWALGAAMSGAAVLDNVLKAAFHRIRPEAFFGPEPGSYSFPSGHALFATCFYGALILIFLPRIRSTAARAVIGVAGTLVVLCIGLSRIYLGVHYASDVFAGYLVGSAWLALLWAARVFGSPPRRA